MKTRSAICFALFAVTWTLAATEFVFGEVIREQVVRIPADKVIDDDLYVFAESATIDGTVNGDLIAFGREVIVNGIIDGDFISAAQEVEINGKVADDARIAGQLLRLGNDADVGDDLIAAGYSLDCAGESRVGGELDFAGFDAQLAGVVAKNVKLAGDRCALSGDFGGDLEIVVNGSGSDWEGDISPGLVVTDDATIDGHLKYRAVAEGTISKSAQVGEVEFTQLEGQSFDSPPSFASRMMAFAQRAFAQLLVGCLLVYLCPNWTTAVTDRLERQSLASFTWGLLSIVGVFGLSLLVGLATVLVAAVLGVVRLGNLIPATLGVGGLSLSTAIVFFVVFAVWIATALVAIWCGKRIVGDEFKNGVSTLIPLLIGVFIIAGLSAIPFVGWFIGLAASVMGVGATMLWLKEKVPAVRWPNRLRRDRSDQEESERNVPMQPAAVV